MVIKHKNLTDDGYATRCMRLERAKRQTAAYCKEIAEKRRQTGARRGEGLVRGYSKDAFLNAIQTEGQEVTGPDAGEWWKGQIRENPFLACGDPIEDGNSANGHRGRMGDVDERYTPSRGWEHWDNHLKDWVPGEKPGSKHLLAKELASC